MPDTSLYSLHILHHKIQRFRDPQRKKPSENIVEKGENAGNQHFLLFPQWFLSNLEEKLLSGPSLICCLLVLSVSSSLRLPSDEELTHYQMTNFRLLQTERVCRWQFFKFDENGRKLSKQVENTVGKGEIARNEQFLVFPQCFQKACFPEASKGVIVWEWVKALCPFTP